MEFLTTHSHVLLVAFLKGHRLALFLLVTVSPVSLAPMATTSLQAVSALCVLQQSSTALIVHPKAVYLLYQVPALPVLQGTHSIAWRRLVCLALVTHLPVLSPHSLRGGSLCLAVVATICKMGHVYNALPIA
jgi:hypothetical protein